MKKTLDDVLAEAAIRDIQMRYCRACDRMDFELLRDCFHPDATTEYFGTANIDEFIATSRQSLTYFVKTTHNTGNQNIEVNGDTAWAEHYTVATHRLAANDEAPERDLITSVRYVDRLECRDGDWRILKRVLILDWTRIDPVGDIGKEPAVQPGQRDRSDPSYALL